MVKTPFEEKGVSVTIDRSQLVIVGLFEVSVEIS